MFSRIIDISLPLSEKTIVYPGNMPVYIETVSDLSNHSSHLSKITLGTHSGTHVDAPAHCLEGGNLLESIPLETLIGKVRVLDFTHEDVFISKESLENKNIKKDERIIAKTKNSEIGFEVFRDDYVFLSGDGAEFLAEKGVALFGIDYLSVKQRGSKDNRSHTALLSKNIPIIEGINLKDVSEGEYTLVCLPLKIVGVEGAPARAVLLS